MWDLEKYNTQESYMPFRGGIARKGECIEGTYRQNAYDDSWEESHAIRYDGELTPEVCEAITKAWNNHPSNQPESSWGALRWSGGNYVERIDVEKRVLITSHCVRLCD